MSRTTLRRIREIWTDIDRAQLRMLEIQTGVALSARSRRASEIADLEAAFARPSRRRA